MGRHAKIDATIDGYVRTRKRPLWGKRAAASTTFEIVRPEPTADRPQRKRLLGLGSLKEPRHESDIIRFWGTAFFRMRRYGFGEHQRSLIASEMIRKGARPPTA
jgi:hypothetical protein